VIIVLGANGQLGQCLHSILKENAVYLSSKDLDITNEGDVTQFMSKQPTGSSIINCAAYTAVDLAEDEKEICFQVNHLGAKNIATACEEFKLKLIHISTDYVFNGQAYIQYSELDSTSPESVYGSSKLKGEDEIRDICSSYLIIRTSWLYSEFGANFVKSILRLSSEREQLGIVADQIGTPTYAIDLAQAIVNIIPNFKDDQKETLHFSNEGVASWYDFAKEIVDISQNQCEVKPIETTDYPTKAKRPAFSVMNKKKIKNTFNITIPHWKESLKLCLKNLS
jgi:dTDP-4-dehydrorhamnose reductase